MRTLFVALMLTLSACVTPTPVPPPPGPGPDVYASACANLARLKCDEGSKPNCASVMQRAQESAITDMRPVCLSMAPTKEAARACGSVRCP
jgi:hypothetical protein